ncbi:MAG: hypothetical protein GKR77_04960 [Legionellales bacterium]|nr:hypothetical protein [Legionellales bacterium]
MPTNYTQKVSEYVKNPPTKRISIQFIQDSIINQLYDRLPDYVLVERLDEAVAFISESVEEFYNPAVPNVTEIESARWFNEAGYGVFDVIPAFNGSEPVWPTFNSSLMKHIQSGFAVLNMTKTTKYIMDVQHKVNRLPREITLTPKPSTTIDPELMLDQQTGLPVSAAISIGLATGIFATMMLVVGCVKLANRNARVPLRMLALLGLVLKRHEDFIAMATPLPTAESWFPLSHEQEHWFERHEGAVHEQTNTTTQPANESQSLLAEYHHAVMPYQAGTHPHADKTNDQVTLQCYSAQQNGIAYLHCLADELQVLVFASDKGGSTLLVPDSQAVPGFFAFQAKRSTCRRAELYNEPFMHCEGTSPEANYFVRLNGPTVPTFVEFCDHLPSSLQLMNFFVAIYQRYWGEDSQEDTMDEQPQNNTLASWSQVEAFRKKVSDKLTGCAELKTAQPQKFVLQEYLETIKDWKISQQPTEDELKAYEMDFKKIGEEIDLLKQGVVEAVANDEFNDVTLLRPEMASSQFQRGILPTVHSLFGQTSGFADPQPVVCALSHGDEAVVCHY